MKNTIKLYRRAQNFHRAVIENCLRLKSLVTETTIEDTLDVSHALTETSRLLKETKREVDDCIKLNAEMMCLAWTHRCLMLDSAEPIRGEYATGTPQTKLMMVLPKKGTDAYAQLMNSMGVTNHDLVVPHWPSMVDHVTELLAAALDPPPGMSGDTYSRYTVTIRAVKELPHVEE